MEDGWNWIRIMSTENPGISYDEPYGSSNRVSQLNYVFATYLEEVTG
jgi:hypothetical protein